MWLPESPYSINQPEREAFKTGFNAHLRVAHTLTEKPATFRSEALENHLGYQILTAFDDDDEATLQKTIFRVLDYIDHLDAMGDIEGGTDALNFFRGIFINRFPHLAESR